VSEDRRIVEGAVVREQDGRPFEALGAMVLRLVHPQTVGSHALGVSLCIVEPGEVVRRHRHAYEEAYYVLEGTGYMNLEGVAQDIRLEPGMTVYVAPNRFHGQTNDGDRTLRILCSLSPPPVEGEVPEFDEVAEADGR
jgi:quercetin dioxygenase-like cupin family protein